MDTGQDTTHGPNIAAALLLGVQSALVAVSALMLFAPAGRLRNLTLAAGLAHQRFELGLGALLISGVLLVLALGVISRGGWARVAALLFEGMSIADAMVSFGVHPATSLITMAIAGIVVALLLRDSRGDSARARLAATPCSSAARPGA